MANTMNVEKYFLELKEFYEKLVRNNPDTVAQIESATRILSFLVAGRFDNGPVISELIYSASNLLVFVHDNIYKNAVKCLPRIEASVERLQCFLTVLEYTEVFLEMAVRKKWGQYTTWVVIIVIQLAKTVLRFVLLLNKRSGIQMNPIVPPADRELLKSSVNLEHDNLEDAWEEENMRNDKEETFTLSSGRQIRTLKSAKRSGLRTWHTPNAEGPEDLAHEASRKRRLLLQKSTKLDPRQLWGECLHIARPLTHLLSMYLFGQNSWKPWLVASGMDVTSLYLIGDTKDLSKREKSELRRRNILLLYYLLRSPFYDKYTKAIFTMAMKCSALHQGDIENLHLGMSSDYEGSYPLVKLELARGIGLSGSDESSKARLLSVLAFISNHVPLSRFLIRPLIDYLPYWQKMYFYVWAS